MAKSKKFGSSNQHHDSLSQSGSGRIGSGGYAHGGNKKEKNSFSSSGVHVSDYGKGKHSGGKKKQFHW